MRYLKTEGDSTHTAISTYLETLNSFSQGHARQDPCVNSKNKPDSDEEIKGGGGEGGGEGGGSCCIGQQ